MNSGLIVFIYLILAIITVFVSLYISRNRKYKNIKKELEVLDKEKNLIASTPVPSELSKVETIIKNEKMEEKYKNWQKRFDKIKNTKISQINDQIIEIDLFLAEKDYKNIEPKIAKVELEIAKAKEAADELLEEIKEITSSEEKYRNIVIKLKTKYRELSNKFQNNKDDYGDIKDVIELQFENIEKRFLDFETIMEKNEYEEVVHIVKALDSMIDHMNVVIKEVPDLVMLSEKIIPKKIKDIIEINDTLTEKGYCLSYLQVSYNMEEASKKINDILDRVKVLNLEECMFELKTILEYLDSLYNDFEKEKLSRKLYEEVSKIFENRLNKTNKIVKDVLDQLEDIKNMYDLKDDDVKEIHNINKKLKKINSDFKLLEKCEEKKDTPYTKLSKDIENISYILNELEEELDESLKSLGSMHEDEQRAREQLDEIQDILNQCKTKIKSYKLPVITNNYFIQLSEANEAILEIIKELSKKPIVIKTLNTRVDTARDLVLKLYNTTNDMIKTAKITENAIVYGNRYRSNQKEIDNGLTKAENLYYKGNYKDALEITLNAINIAEPGITKKVMNIYNK